MEVLSTRVAAKKLELHPATLARYVAAGKVPSPKMVATGSTTTHLWTEEEIEHVRKLLPKIANGRKTRYQKLRKKQKKAQARAPVVRKKKKRKK
jgi:recombinational DNA repair protein RecT